MTVAVVAIAGAVAVTAAAAQAYQNREERKANEEQNRLNREGTRSEQRSAMHEVTKNPLTYFVSEVMKDYTRGAHTAEAQGWKAGNDGKWYDKKGNVVKNPGSTAWMGYGEWRRKQMAVEQATDAAAGAYNQAQPTWSEETQTWTPGDQQAFVDPEIWQGIGGNGRLQLQGDYNLDADGVFISNEPIEQPLQVDAVTQAPTMEQGNAFDGALGQASTQAQSAQNAQGQQDTIQGGGGEIYSQNQQRTQQEAQQQADFDRYSFTGYDGGAFE